MVSVSIYLTEESIYSQVETTVEDWLATAGISIATRDDPVIGS